jgi:enamine deaminase RidA (YjgF/YER057c/UK114 family)
MNKPYLFRLCLLVATLIALTAQLTAAQTGNAPGTVAHAETNFLNPKGLSTPAGFTQVVVAQPGRLVYVSGQTARNATGDVVGKGDLRAQVAQTMENLKTALTAAGATMEDVVKLNYYVVNLKPDQVPIIREVRKKYLSAEHPPASTLVGVTALVQDELMIEVEAIAALK